MLKALCRVLLGLWVCVGMAYGQGCKTVDRQRLATVMGIDSPLVPITNLEIPSCANIVLGDGYAGFLLNETNTPLNGGIRSELAIDFPFVEGDTIEYRWSMMLPTADTPGGDSQQWWALAQWHDQPDPRLGQTWATLKPQSPPVAIYVEKQAGVVGIGLLGIGGKKISWAPVPLGVWMDFTVSIRWSTNSSGLVRIQVLGHPALDVSSPGVNMLNGYQHYFKVGQYRAPTISKAAVVYVKNVRIRKL